MEFIKVKKPGLLTTIQDLGRVFSQKYGISSSGAMDSLSLRLGNIIVGNEESEAAIEITLIGPVFEFTREGVIAITGANISPKINGKDVEQWRSVPVSAGDTISFGRVEEGCRSYLIIAGGIDVPLVMGSRSTFIRGNFGGHQGRALIAGDTISVRKWDKMYRSVIGRGVPKKYRPQFNDKRKLRFVLGPQADQFEEKVIAQLSLGTYEILSESDRMGYRLQGPTIKHKESSDIISDYITAGSIQVPGNGQPIILMADCQMTGGYAKLGVVISVDLPYLAQRKPGEKVQFERIEIDEAQALWKAQEHFLTTMKMYNV